MSGIQWFSLILILLSFTIFVFSLVNAKNRIQPTVDEFNHLKESIELEVNHFTNEFEFQYEKINQIKEKIDQLKGHLQSDTMSFEYFQIKQAELTDTLEILKENLPKIAAKTSQSILQNVKEESSRVWNTLKLTFKKTFKKQKARFSK